MALILRGKTKLFEKLCATKKREIGDDECL